MNLSSAGLQNQPASNSLRLLGSCFAGVGMLSPGHPLHLANPVLLNYQITAL